MEHCPHCGERVHPEDAYCFECGTELGDLSDEGGGERRGRDAAPTARRRGRGPDRRDRPDEPARGHAPEGDPARDRPDEPARGRAPEGEPARDQPDEPARGRAPEGEPARAPARGRRREPARRHRERTGRQVESLTTLWVGAALSVVSLLENVAIILFADDIVELIQQEDVGFGDISADAIAIQGGLGLVIAFAVAVVCAYYYRKGYVDRKFFWLLIVAGVAGFFLGGGLSVVLLIVVGAYGLLSVLRDDRPRGQPTGDVGRR